MKSFYQKAKHVNSDEIDGKLLKLAGIDQHLSFTHFATFHLLDQNDKDTCALQQNTATKANV